MVGEYLMVFLQPYGHNVGAKRIHAGGMSTLIFIVYTYNMH